jgi:FkbM family methyltransferase
VAVEGGDVVLDVGANVGVAAAFFAVVCGAGTVHCFEPVEPVLELLRQNVGHMPACVLHHEGLYSRAGPARITYYPRATAMSGLYADPSRDRELVRTVLMNHGYSPAEAEDQLAGRYEQQILSCQLRTLSSFLREEKLMCVDLIKGRLISRGFRATCDQERQCGEHQRGWCMRSASEVGSRRHANHHLPLGGAYAASQEVHPFDVPQVWWVRSVYFP